MSIDASAYADPNYFKVSLKTPMLVGIGGGPQAGKFELCEVLMNKFKGSHHETKVAIISLTDFYRELTSEERALYESGNFNLDHPNVFDFDLVEATLKRLLQNKEADIPVWDHARHTRVGVRRIPAVDVLLLEGTLALYPKNLRELMFMKVFIDVDSDQRLIRRVQKLTEGTGRTMSIKRLLTEYVNFVKPMFDEFISPTMRYADIIIPRGASENPAALQVLENHLEDHLHTRAKASTSTTSSPTSSPMSPSIITKRAEYNELERSSTPLSIKSTHTDVLATSAESRYKDIPE